MNARRKYLCCFAAVVQMSACGRLGYQTLVATPGDGGPADTLEGEGGAALVVDDGAAPVGDIDGGAPRSDGAAGAAGGTGGMNAGGMNMAGSPDASAALDAMTLDAPVMPPPGLPDCEVRMKMWQAEFATDPTKADLNADGQPDWSLARGSFAASQLRNGRWEPVGDGVLLDTAPQDDFSTRTLLFVRMQHLGLSGTGSNGLEGALAWLNLDNQKPNRIAVFLRLLRTSENKQTLELKANGTAAPIASFVVEEKFVDLALEANPKTEKVRLWIGGEYQGEWNLPRTGGPAYGDAFATVGTFYGSAVFDSARVERCGE